LERLNAEKGPAEAKPPTEKKEGLADTKKKDEENQTSQEVKKNTKSLFVNESLKLKNSILQPSTYGGVIGKKEFKEYKDQVDKKRLFDEVDGTPIEELEEKGPIEQPEEQKAKIPQPEEEKKPKKKKDNQIVLLDYKAINKANLNYKSDMTVKNKPGTHQTIKLKTGKTLKVAIRHSSRSNSQPDRVKERQDRENSKLREDIRQERFDKTNQSSTSTINIINEKKK
jgi:hypothetical protein